MTINGHCYCGGVTFSASQSPSQVDLCHCDSCRRATGTVAAAWACFNAADISWTGDEPRSFEKNAGTQRLSCATCGSPVAYRTDKLPGEIWLALGLFDQPEAFPPARHVMYREKLSWLHLQEDLPKTDGFDGFD